MKEKRNLKQINVILTFLVLFTGIITLFFVKNAYSADTYTWALNSKITVTLKENILTVSGSGDMPEVYDNQGNIPEWSKYCKSGNIKLVIQEGITGISSYAFYNCKGITGNLTIPSTVTQIGESAFENCSGLSGKLILPANLLKIRNSAFKNCTGFSGSLLIPSKVSEVENYAFYKCIGFNNVLTISEGVKIIGDYAFSGCSGFTGNLTIPNSVTIIQSNAFSNCKNFNGTLSISKNISSIETGAFSGCEHLTGNLVIPNGLTSISGNVFSGCSGFNGTITIPSGIKTIGNGAFLNCSGLTGNLIIPNSVTEIGSNAFSGCKSLAGSLQLPTSLTKIENGTFTNCSNLSGTLSMPAGVSYIGDFAFDGCYSLRGGLVLPVKLNEIGAYAFRACSGLSGRLIIPENVSRIGGYAFSGCIGLNGTLSIKPGIRYIGTAVFLNCKGLTGILELPDTVISIGDNIILGTEITQVINRSSAKFNLSRNTEFTYWIDTENMILNSVANGTAYKKIYSASDKYSIIAAVSTNNIIQGEKVKISTVAFGGSGGYTYSFLIQNTDTNEWHRFSDFNNSNTLIWTATSSGNRVFYAEARDSSGTVIRSSAINVTVNKNVQTLTITANSSVSKIAVGEDVTITADASGGSENYTYSFLMQNIDTNAWYRFSDFNNSNTITWTAASAGNRAFYAEVKDSSGTVIRSSAVNVIVNENIQPLTITANSSASKIVVGENVTITAGANGGSGDYTYSFLMQNIDTNAWYRFSDFNTSNTLTWAATSAGNRAFYVEVKDSSGTVVRSSAINVIVNKNVQPLTITANSSASKIVVGENITITAAANGGGGNYTYSFLVQNKDTNEWYRFSDFNESNMLTWTATSSGNRVFYAEVKDSSGAVVRSSGIDIITSKQ